METRKDTSASAALLIFALLRRYVSWRQIGALASALPPPAGAEVLLK